MILLTAVTVWILYSQYWAMRVDTRPWIQVKPSDQNPVPQVGKPIAMPLQFVNAGKTPAKRLLAYMFVEVVDNDKATHLPELEGAEIRFLDVRHKRNSVPERGSRRACEIGEGNIKHDERRPSSHRR
jgi:hypothetical protein